MITKMMPIEKIWGEVENLLPLGIYHNLGYLAACIGSYKMEDKYEKGTKSGIIEKLQQNKLCDVEKDSMESGLRYNDIHIIGETILKEYYSLLKKYKIDISISRLEEVLKELYYTTDVLFLKWGKVEIDLQMLLLEAN